MSISSFLIMSKNFASTVLAPMMIMLTEKVYWSSGTYVLTLADEVQYL